MLLEADSAVIAAAKGVANSYARYNDYTKLLVLSTAQETAREDKKRDPKAVHAHPSVRLGAAHFDDLHAQGQFFVDWYVPETPQQPCVGSAQRANVNSSHHRIVIRAG